MPQQLETTHEIIERELIVYRRERSAVWQCRFKVGNIWKRASTGERDLQKAIRKSHEVRMEAEILRRNNLPVITRRFSDIARIAVKRMEEEVKNGEGKAIYSDYISAINRYLIPILGKYSITNIDRAALDHLASERIRLMNKVPTKSTLMNHNAALNRVFDEAVLRQFMPEISRPKLEAKGKKSIRRAAFDLNELKAVILNFDSWIAQAKTKDSRERRQVMRDYVELLIDTGARPGKELMDLKWNQVKFVKHPESLRTGQKYVDDDGEEGEIVLTDLNRGVEMTVSGKTGTRVILGRNPSVKVLTRIAREHYAVENLIIDPLAGVAVPTNNDYVLRTKTHRIDPSSSFQKMLEDYLTEHNLLIDPVTGHKRVFYSFRHTYATLALTYDKVYGPILEEQMGTSQGMIKKHYSHIKVSEIFHELAGKESRRRIAESATVAELYKATNTTSKKPRT